MIPVGSSPWLRLLPALMIAGVVLFATGPGLSVPRTDYFSPLPDGHASDAQRVDTLRSVSRHIVQFTNRERRQRGLNALTKETALRRIACEHTRDMLAREFVRHENPDGERVGDRVAQGHRRLIGEAGENLWAQTGRKTVEPKALASQIVEKWMGSPPHRKNILRPNFSHLGVCTLRQGERIRGTQVFTRTRAYLRTPLPRSAPASGTIVAPIERTFPRDASIEKYDFWDPETKEPVTRPVLFSDTLQLPKTTGPVRPRFYVPQANQYRIHWGPEIRLTSP